MALSIEEKTILVNEVALDSQSLGYAGKTVAEITAIINAPGSASLPNRVAIVSPVPVVKTGAELMAVVSVIDGLVDPLNAEGVGLARVLDWIDKDTDPYAAITKYFFSASAQLDVASDGVRGTIDYLRGVEIPPTRTLISEAAMNALMALGTVLMSRAQELFSRNLTEAEVASALAP